MSPEQTAALGAAVTIQTTSDAISSDISLAAWLSPTRADAAPADVAVSLGAEHVPNLGRMSPLEQASPHPLAHRGQNDLDKTTFAPVGATRHWAIETEDGDIVPLPGGDVVIGRRPKASGVSVAVVLTDATKTLSKTHARLHYDVSLQTWSVVDLASTNGVAILTSDGEQVVQPNVATPFDEYVAFGMLRCRVIRH